MPRRTLRHCLVFWTLLLTLSMSHHGLSAPRAWPHPDTVANKGDLFVVEFVSAVPTSLPGGVALTPITERIALARVDPRYAAPSRTPQLLSSPTAIRRVERNARFFVQRSPPLAPHPFRDLRSTQPTPWHRLTRSQVALFARPVSKRARVGIVDTGLDYTHPDLLGNIGAGVNFLTQKPSGATPRSLPPPFAEERDDPSEMDYNGHGTHVAGIIGARHNDFGIDGLATAVELIGLKVFDRHGTGYLSDILQAVQWAMHNRVDILNMSFGTYEPSPMLERALQRAHAAGMVLVAAAGNDGLPAATYPAALPFVMSVGALGPQGISRVSNHGSDVNVFAPGHEVMSTTTCMLGPQVYTAMSGTSAAAAHVTGVLSQAMLSGMRAPAARSYVEQRLIAQPGAADPYGPVTMRTLHAARVLADLQARPHQALGLTDLTAHQEVDNTLAITLRVQNLGNQTSIADGVTLRLWQQQQTQTQNLGVLPALAPQASFVHTVRVPLPASWVTSHDTSVGVQVALQNAELQQAAPISAALGDKPKARLQVGNIWVTPSNHPSGRQMHVQLRNAGNAAAEGLTMRGFGIAATHEGIWSVPQTPVTRATPLAAVAPQTTQEVVLPITGAMPQANALTWLVQLSQDGTEIERAIQSWDVLPSGQAQLYYNQRAHMGMVEAAVTLLQLQNVELSDLHDPGAPHKGSIETSRDWGSAVSVGMSRWRWDWDTDWPGYPESARTLIDGASACDGIDVAFGDTGVSTWDTHYWIVNEGDRAGLGDVSALQKIYALMLGGYGSEIRQGAIEAYNQGDKARAWWMVGHAAHLLGDLSTGAHTINRNWHGVIGDPYHDWMGKHYQSWPATVPLSMGGFIEPYRTDLLSTPERLRFLAYTVARIGASFPWHQTRGWIPVRGHRMGDGSRDLQGDWPHYDDHLRDYFATYPDHPHLLRDINKDEALTVWNTCVAVDELEDMQFLADCWDGGDGHIDRNNVLLDDIDGDLSRIADQAYTYGVRAIAGLIVLFARETGQL